MAKKKVAATKSVKKRAKRGEGLKYKDKVAKGLCTVGGCGKKHGKRSEILCDFHAEAKNNYMKAYMQKKRDEAKSGKKPAKKKPVKKSTVKKARVVKAPKTPVKMEEKKAG